MSQVRCLQAVHSVVCVFCPFEAPEMSPKASQKGTEESQQQ